MNETVARDRNGLEVLGFEECQELLRSRNVGRIAVVDAGVPIIVPVVYAVAGVSIVFRSPVGSKLEAAERNQPVAFEIDEHDAEARRGWSVLVTGVADLIDDPAIVAGLDGLGLDSWALDGAGELRWVRLRAESVTGRASGPR